MSDFIRLGGKRDLGADIVHGLLNTLFAATVVFLSTSFSTPWPAYVLVILSKWRTIAVRPRYWGANLLGALPDLVVGLSFAAISWNAGQVAATYQLEGESLPVSLMIIQIILGFLYAVWLVAIKPLKSENGVGVQALITQFVGLTAIFSLSRSVPLVMTMLMAFVVAFSAARQALNNFDEKDLNLMSSVWGLLMMELAFVSWHWSVFYQLTPLIRIPQIAIISTVIGIVAYRVYRAWQDDRRVTWDELGLPVVFTVILTLVVLFAFSGL